MRVHLLLFLCAALFIALQSTAKAGLITLVPSGGFPTGANVNALAGPLLASDFDSEDISGSGMGFAAASLSGNSATHDYSLKLDFGVTPAFFDSSYFGSFARTSVLGERASAESILLFKVDTSAAYDISGFLSIDDALGTTIPGNVELEIELLEFVSLPGPPPPVALFYSYQVSKSTLDESFTVGGMGGDSTNTLVGLSTGMLDPTKIYRYRTLVTTNAIDIDAGGPLLATNGTASLSGAHVISISAVPEPSSILLLALFASVYVLMNGRLRSRYDTGAEQRELIGRVPDKRRAVLFNPWPQARGPEGGMIGRRSTWDKQSRQGNVQPKRLAPMALELVSTSPCLRRRVKLNKTALRSAPRSQAPAWERHVKRLRLESPPCSKLLYA